MQHRKNYLLTINLPCSSTTVVEKIKAVESNSVIHIISIISEINDFELNKMTKDLKEIKTIVEQKGFSCTSELIKISKGNESQQEIITHFKQKLNATELK